MRSVVRGGGKSAYVPGFENVVSVCVLDCEGESMDSIEVGKVSVRVWEVVVCCAVLSGAWRVDEVA